jgi:uncharacterized phage-associated protein
LDHSVHDVAAAVLHTCGRPISAMKLQKLVYYCQAWHLAWLGRPLFRDRIEAWANGPVVPELYRKHRGRFEVDDWPWGDASALPAQQQAVIAAVMETYGAVSARALSERTHRELPWRDARAGLNDGDRSSAVIAHDALQAYYSRVAEAV